MSSGASDGAGRRGKPWADGLEVAHLAHVRLTLGGLREAGFDVPVGDERLERAVEQGAVLARELGRLPRMADWKEARLADPVLLSEWQVYRLVDVPGGPWAAFQFLVRERLREEGVTSRPTGCCRRRIDLPRRVGIRFRGSRLAAARRGRFEIERRVG